SNLFELFYQVDVNLDRSDGGLGVGLALVRSLVQMHGGTVEGHSSGRGQGSEFIVRLPCVEPTAVAQPVAAPILAKTAAVRLRILVVDDNVDAARSLAKLLQILGHDTQMAHDGPAAVEAGLRERPDVVLLDIGLPQMNGYQVCQSFRRNGLADALIVAITGYGQDTDRQLSHEAGFDAHLVKPVALGTVQELLATRGEKRSA